MLRYLILVGCLAFSGCSLLPEIAHQPTLHNPFPQVSRVAVAPFFVLGEDPTLSGREVALAYFAELQSVPGFEVVPVGVVEREMEANNIALRGPDDARRLAQLLNVDALVVGAVTDYTPWYPPRMGLRVEWYAANPCFHPIPPGYGLPWGTPEEEGIPAPLVFEAEMALAKAQLATQTPGYQELPAPWPASLPAPANELPSAAGGSSSGEWPSSEDPPKSAESEPQLDGNVQPASHEATSDEELAATVSGVAASGVAEPGVSEPGMPPDWPNPRGFIPAPPSCDRPACQPNGAPVLRHTQIYRGNDTEFTEALASYVYFRDDARFGGWQRYLQCSSDFIRFCCHMHVCEMLSARGGAGQTRVVWRWPTIR